MTTTHLKKKLVKKKVLQFIHATTKTYVLAIAPQRGR